MKPPRFSIIMNVYNGERFLREALASVFAQTFGDWELIFWDDCSTDGSAAVLAGFPRDERVRYFLSPEQTPLAPARDEAIARARGEWLAFLDQDDVWTADKLQKQAALIDASASDRLAIVYGRTMMFGDVDPPQDFDHWHEFGDLPSGNIFESLFVDSCYICQSAACLRTEEVRRIGPVPPELHHAHDYFLYTEIARDLEAAAVQDVVCWYRVHGGAMTPRYYRQVQLEAIRIAERWRHALDPAVFRRRVRIQNTMIGLWQVRSGQGMLDGLRTIARDGSVPYLLARPFARAARALRRAVRRSPRPPRPDFA